MLFEQQQGSELMRLLERGRFSCNCGHRHEPGVDRVLIGCGAVRALPELVRNYGGKRVFLLSGHDSFEAAGRQVTACLCEAGIPYSMHVFPRSPVKPTEETLGAAVMHFDYACDLIVGIGSGVVNDTAKLLARATDRTYLFMATAPSMDGFVSATSSMDRDGLKVSLPSRAASAVISDLDILRDAPLRLLQAGIGDMLAKIVSLFEWRLAHLIVGEYWCPEVAGAVETALNSVLQSVEGLIRRETAAVRSVTEGLVMAGMAMNYVGMSRPASGMEHYFSHIWDMRSLCFPEAGSDLHGIQTAIGTLYSLRAYEALTELQLRPDERKAARAWDSFSLAAWNRELTEFIGPGAEAMIRLEQKERKYSPDGWRRRFAAIQAGWDGILAEISLLPSSVEVEALMRTVGIPTDAAYLGYDRKMLQRCLKMTGDIRDKYIGSRLFRDLGVLDEVAEMTFSKNHS